MSGPGPEPPGGRAPPVAARRNTDADWDRWPVHDYLRENYRALHPCDAAVIRHHAAFYRTLPPGSVAASVECGAGPNLYPLMSAAAACRRIDALEPGAAGRAYLRSQLSGQADASWEPFYALCREHDPALPPRLDQALARVRVVAGDLSGAPEGAYGLASMTFVAESVTESGEEFARLCRDFVRQVHPGGLLVAAFMAGMPSYRIGTGPVWPAFPVDAAAVRDAFAPHTERLRLTRVPKDPTLPEYGDDGMVLLRAVRRGRPGPQPSSSR
ncbi:class I SAM-dependent methyltransferase [Streptomyces sp. t39]|uniref:class I SAM-dependent methyltransferase n=1 Tax=Streptomyces sp. t39 TaxID=1828156 RepID=UPI0011CD6E3C|nr:class I SAM-dependent methyltransferase [Streptomyces sp. t39]TXS52132.1 class I SAM-dependent methyltransferase [Streptomyces sp. t39]